MGETQKITVSSQLKSANAVSDIENHSGKKNRETYAHKNPDIDQSKSGLNAEFDFYDRKELLENHYQETIEKHNKNNNSEARRWDLEKYLETFEGRTVKRMGKETKNARWSTASQISYFGGKDSLNPVLEALEDAGATQEEICEAYLSGYEEYVQKHNEKFTTLPIYHSDVHFDETTPHGHDAIVVLGHTEKGRASDSINNALGEMYGYKAGFKGNQENMARYLEENDKVMFDAISSKLEALGSAHGIDFEFEFFRTGQTDSDTYEIYKIKMDFENQAEELQETEKQLEMRSKAQKKNTEKSRERKGLLNERERDLNLQQSNLAMREGSVIAREKELEEKEKALAASETMLAMKERKIREKEMKFQKIESVVTGAVSAIIKDSSSFMYDVIQNKSITEFTPAQVKNAIDVAVSDADFLRRPIYNKEKFEKEQQKAEAKRVAVNDATNDGPEL